MFAILDYHDIAFLRMETIHLITHAGSNFMITIER